MLPYWDAAQIVVEPFVKFSNMLIWKYLKTDGHLAVTAVVCLLNEQVKPRICAMNVWQQNEEV